MFDCVHLCPCGYTQSVKKACTCSHSAVTKYQKRISGPLLDRIDIHVEVPEVDYEKLSDDRTGEPSSEIRKRVQAARDRQRIRFRETDIICNSDMRVAEVRQFCKLDEAGDSLVRAAMSQLNLSARGYHRVLKLARTIADLAGSGDFQSVYLADALQYRPKSMMG
jgi:magnesium chelatase family protein